ncbi:uracil-DNA glycosylase family protein [Mariniphaga sediminis]|jgi:uracil-DNA glycosylase|uniref:Uracil-DNA glycosylase family protein n=1 Tax=Mariniphaga sediminis TaxID=1628158 RepID=A0A399D4J3_9BACT|nr:uracil-DNA glycosylase family protein [Mariniphaga sediminis]RIH66333.1 uracil-DNA glycosylase family protein [Mariniphaga sediminis]
MKQLLQEISKCTVCEPHLEFGARPVLTAHKKSKIVIVGQAPGLIVHKSGIPWGDKSGDNLRNWMQVDKETFYDPEQIALIPMGFCYPGKGRSGDLPPRKECAPLWHEKLLTLMPEVKLTILIGKYSQAHYLGNSVKVTLTETVRCFDEYLPDYFVLPHPSPRNNIWQAKNEWFGKQVIPEFQRRIKEALA